MKRKRTDEVALPVPETPADPASGYDPGSSQHEADPPLDSFAEDLALPIEALHEAVTDATAFLQPSEQLSTLARAAARVSCTLTPLLCVSAFQSMHSGITVPLSKAVQDLHASLLFLMQHCCMRNMLQHAACPCMTILLSLYHPSICPNSAQPRSHLAVFGFTKTCKPAGTLLLHHHYQLSSKSTCRPPSSFEYDARASC